MGPDVLINNFDVKYNEELYAKSMIKYKPNNGIAANTNTTTTTQFLVPQTNEIEDLRPKSQSSLLSKINVSICKFTKLKFLSKMY